MYNGKINILINAVIDGENGRQTKIKKSTGMLRV
jgi:hypothetical protein